MGKSSGLRSGTRYSFQRPFRKHGTTSTNFFLKQYRVGDIVDIIVNGTIQKGLPYKFYHGRTGVVFNVTKSAVGVTLNKQVGCKFIQKKINIGIEHVRHSRSRENFLCRVRENLALRVAAKSSGSKAMLKRQPLQPRPAFMISPDFKVPIETIAPVPFETTI